MGHDIIYGEIAFGFRMLAQGISTYLLAAGQYFPRLYHFLEKYSVVRCLDDFHY